MAGLGALYEFYIVDKSVSITLQNDNTLNDDTHLTYPLAANEDIDWELTAFYNAGAGGIQCAMSGPAGYTALHYSANLDISGATKVTSAIATAWDVTVAQAAASSGLVRIHGHLHNGANAGTLVFRWAQNTSNVAATIIEEGSSLKVIRYP